MVLGVADETLSLDIRHKPTESGSSIAVKPKAFLASGSASVVVDNEDLEGMEATLVIVDANGVLVAQMTVFIGGAGN